jgi:hypothetical protein
MLGPIVHKQMAESALAVILIDKANSVVSGPAVEKDDQWGCPDASLPRIRGGPDKLPRDLLTDSQRDFR